MCRSATLWPAGTASRTVISVPLIFSTCPGARGTRATAMLSFEWSWMAEFSAVGSFAISRSSMVFFELTEQHQFGAQYVQMDVELVFYWVNPHTFTRNVRNLRWSIDHHEILIGFHAFQ